MRRTYERGTKTRLSLEEVNVGGKKRRKRHVCCAVLRYVLCAKFSQILEVLQDSHRLFGSRNSPTTGILHTIRHVYRSVWPTEKLSLALVPRSNVLRMIMKLAYSRRLGRRKRAEYNGQAFSSFPSLPARPLSLSGSVFGGEKSHGIYNRTKPKGSRTSRVWIVFCQCGGSLVVWCERPSSFVYA